jgi:hypothetical protein
VVIQGKYVNFNINQNFIKKDTVKSSQASCSPVGSKPIGPGLLGFMDYIKGLEQKS